jgi:hypothetical protein
VQILRIGEKGQNFQIVFLQCFFLSAFFRSALGAAKKLAAARSLQSRTAFTLQSHNGNSLRIQVYYLSIEGIYANI